MVLDFIATVAVVLAGSFFGGMVDSSSSLLLLSLDSSSYDPSPSSTNKKKGISAVGNNIIMVTPFPVCNSYLRLLCYVSHRCILLQRNSISISHDNSC